jgi:Flp pilus assembly protein TadG
MGDRKMRESRLGGLRRRGADESGVTTVIVAIMLVVFLGIGAFAIDLSSYWKSERQAQAAADAGALAAADTLTGGSTTSVGSVGTNYGTTNYPGSSVTVAQPTTTSVKVTVNATVQGVLGGIFGIHSEQVTGKATAQVTSTSTSTQCVTKGSNCYAIFAMSTSCSGGVTFQGGGYNIQGGIWSNGGLNSGGGGSSFGPTYYGKSCTPLTGGGDTFRSGPTGEPAQTTWPIDYSKSPYFPACSGSSCTGPLGTPSYCTYASTSNYSFTASPANGIYCDVGSSKTPSDPATYTGAVSFNNGGWGCASSPSNYPQATFLAGTIASTAGSMCIEAYNYPTNHLIFYAASSSSTAINDAGGSDIFDGDFFAPAGGITINAGSQEFGFLEGQNVTMTAGGIIGDGPPDTGGTAGGGTTTSAVASLIQ